MDDKLKIIVLGTSNSGKSTILYRIKQMLRNDGFITLGDGGVDFKTEAAFDKHASEGFTAKLDAIKRKTTIKITEEQSANNFSTLWIPYNEEEPLLKLNTKCWVKDSLDNIHLCEYIIYRKNIFQKYRFGFYSYFYNKILEDITYWQILKLPDK